MLHIFSGTFFRKLYYKFASIFTVEARKATLNIPGPFEKKVRGWLANNAELYKEIFSQVHKWFILAWLNVDVWTFEIQLSFIINIFLCCLPLEKFTATALQFAISCFHTVRSPSLSSCYSFFLHFFHSRVWFFYYCIIAFDMATIFLLSTSYAFCYFSLSFK